MKKITALSIVILSCSTLVNADENKHKLAYDFGYALQASGNCSDLSMRLDTREKVAKLIGSDPSAKDSPYNESYADGLLSANLDYQLCETAWKKYGCTGSETAKLLQGALSGNGRPLCQFSK